MNLKLASQTILNQFLADVPQWRDQLPKILSAVDLICQSHRRDALLLTCGNGGSAADASHIVGELVKSFRIVRPVNDALRERLVALDSQTGAETARRLQQGIRAMSLSQDSVLLTAMANDVDSKLGFAQQVCALGRPGDILLALSTSGQSVNIVRALQVARSIGMHTIGLTGRKPCPMQALSDICFQAPADETYRIQEFHLSLYHVLCAMIETELFAAD